MPSTATAGKYYPKEVVAVVRPANYVSQSDSKVLDQKYIFKSNVEMSLKVMFNGYKKGLQNADHCYSLRVAPSSHRGVHGIYVFPLRCRFQDLFQKAGVFTFSFSLVSCSQKVQFYLCQVQSVSYNVICCIIIYLSD